MLTILGLLLERELDGREEPEEEEDGEEEGERGVGEDRSDGRTLLSGWSRVPGHYAASRRLDIMSVSQFVVRGYIVVEC